MGLARSVLHLRGKIQKPARNAQGRSVGLMNIYRKTAAAQNVQQIKDKIQRMIQNARPPSVEEDFSSDRMMIACYAHQRWKATL